jgi:hypothetical protein
VARLFVLDDGSVRVVHVDVDTDRPFVSPTDPAAGFRANAFRYAEAILAPGLDAELAALRAGLSDADRARTNPAVLRAGRRVWTGERALVTREELQAELRAEGFGSLPPDGP